MIELFQIFLSFFVFFIISSVPLNIFNTNKNFQNKIFFALYNIIINFNILLLLSFFKLNINFYAYIIIFFYVFLYLIIYLKKNFLQNVFKLNLFFLFFFFIILSINVGSNLDLSWDVKLFYFPKALFFFEGGFIKDLSHVHGYEWHPHLFSYIWAFYWKINFLELEYFGRLIYVFLYLLSLITLLDYFKFKNHIKFLILIFLIYTNYQYKVLSSGPEILIISLLTICSVIVYEIYSKNKLSNTNLLLLLLIINLLFWTKTESIIYIFFLYLIILLSKIKNLQKFYLLSYILFIIMIKILIYKYYNLEINPRKGIYEINFLSKLNISNFFETIIIVTKYLIYYTLKNYSILLSILSIFFIKNKNNSKFLKIYLLLNLLLIYLIYLTYTFDIKFYVSSTLERVLLSMNGFIAIAQIIFAKQFIKKNK